MNPNQIREAALSALKPRGQRVLPFNDLARKVFGLAPTAADEDDLRAVVADLERRGEIVRVRGEKLSLIEFTDFQAGTLAVRGEGRAFLLSGVPGVPDTPVTGLASALDGDVVLVRVEAAKAAPKSKGGRAPRFDPRPTGTVVKVLVRRRETVVGKLVRGPEGTFVVPFDRKIDARLAVPDGKDLNAPDGIFVEARIIAWPDDKRLALAEVTDTIGFEGDAGVDVEVVARKWGIPRKYPETVIAEAEASVREVGEGERRERTDFTARTIVTIDGETARDFDDAIEAEQLPNGGFRIGIHIADVSHYVPVGSALDAEAYERGTSVYFPDRAIAMLPERLSNDLCSLRPDEERRTVSAVLTLDKHGETVKSEFYRSLIKSRARLTYNEVGDFLEKEEGQRRDGAPAFPPQEVSSPFPSGVAQRAAHALQSRRVRRGSLDFDLPDSDVILGEEGEAVAILKAVRNEAHRLIEEFMLAANEAVARHLVFVPTPALYRVHDRPDETRLAALRVVLGPLGYDLPEDEEEVTPATFQAILDQAQGKPEERFVDDLVLRSQKKALYSEDCRGHYALAATYYAHFTSPIRRYPDLLVHRALVEWIAARRAPRPEEAEGRTRWFKEAALHCSSRERRAESAEREAISWKKFVFLSKRVGDEFWAYVSAVVGFGLFVTLEDIYVDGLIPISSLQDDFYRFEDVEHRLVGASTGRVFRLGDRLRVKLVKADSEKRGLDFVPVGASAGPKSASRVEALQHHARKPAPRRGASPRRGPAPRRRR
ncbi:MAG: ribonuclease R [Acidobacteria bacterium]|nr:ribonuclease R [Acidobacteriota bacterium]